MPGDYYSFFLKSVNYIAGKNVLISRSRVFVQRIIVVIPVIADQDTLGYRVYTQYQDFLFIITTSLPSKRKVENR